MGLKKLVVDALRWDRHREDLQEASAPLGTRGLQA